MTRHDPPEAHPAMIVSRVMPTLVPGAEQAYPMHTLQPDALWSSAQTQPKTAPAAALKRSSRMGRREPQPRQSTKTP